MLLTQLPVYLILVHLQAKLQEEIEALKTKGEERRAARAAAERESAEKRAALEASADVAMEGLMPQVVAT